MTEKTTKTLQELDAFLVVINQQLDELAFVLAETKNLKMNYPIEWVERRDAALEKYRKGQVI